jgi:hypothetical protein
MSEWQIIESDDFSPLPPEEPERGSASERRWLLLMSGILIFLIGAGVFSLWQQRANNRLRLEEDLADYIFEEETARYLGRPDLVLSVSDAPPEWQQAYWEGFVNGSASPPTDIGLSDVDFDGVCATMTVDLNRQRQVRSYCLSDQGWLRAPVPRSAWGSEKEIIGLGDDASLIFFTRDRAFARALADDLDALFEEIAGWIDGSAAAANSYQGLQINLQPRDLAPPLLLDEDQRLSFNSPWLVDLPGGDHLTGEAAVRLAVAEALIGRADPANETASLPGEARFLKAARLVAAVHLLLTPEAQSALFEGWREAAGGEWDSPFFADLLAESRSGPQLELAAQLVAAYIYQSEGRETLHQVIQGAGVAQSWDELFQAALDRPTVVLESQVAAYAAGQSLSSTLALSSSAPVAPLPLRAKVVAAGDQGLAQGWLPVEAVDETTPILVELPANWAIRTRSGEALPPECLPPGSDLEIEGRWLEIRHRLQASRITVLDLTPMALEPAPADTLAYVVSRSSTEAPVNPTLANIGPLLRPHFINGDTATQILFALRPEGRLEPLITIGEGLSATALPVAAGEPVHFLFRRELPECDQSWFIHYEPLQGITRQWLAPLSPIQWLWRADQRDLVFVSPTESSLRYDIHQTSSGLLSQPIGSASSPLLFLGWNVTAGRLVSTSSWFDEIYIGLFDLPTGRITRMTQPFYLPLRSRRLSPDGNWLAYLAGAKNILGPPDRVDLLHLVDERQLSLIEVEEGQGIGPPVWSLNWEQPALAVLSGPATERNQVLPTPVRLLIASPDQPDEVTVVAEAAAGEQLATPIFCPDGAVLYVVEQPASYQLRRQEPGQPARTLLEQDQPFRPIACP